MPRKVSKKVIVKLKRKNSVKLSTFSKLLKSDLIRLQEDQIIDDAITILESKLVSLNLPNINDILSLKNEFHYNSNQLLKASKHMMNFIIYFISSTRDKFNKCGNHYAIPLIPQNFDELLKLLFLCDFKDKDKKNEIKNNMIKLTELINECEVQMATNKLNREKLKSSDVRVDDLNVHTSDLLLFKSLALELDELVFDYYQLRYKSIRFRSDVMFSVTKRCLNDLKIFLDRFQNSISILNDSKNLNYLLKRSVKKSVELKTKKSKNQEYVELSKELDDLLKKIDDEEEESDRRQKELNNELQDKLDQNAISYLDKSEEYREITYAVILQFKKSRAIKQHLVKMCKLIDTRFKVKYPNLNEANYFTNEIDELLISEIISCLDHFAREREAQERIEKKKQDELEKAVNTAVDLNSETEETDKKEDDKDDKEDKKVETDKEIRSDDDEKNLDNKSIKDKEEVELDDSACANVKVR